MPDMPYLEEIDLAAPFPDVCAAFLDQRDPVFLDSSLTDAHLGRYSYLTANPLLTLQSKNGRLCVRPHLPSVLGSFHPAAFGDPFVTLQHVLRLGAYDAAPGLPPFQGGAIGYFGYDLAHHVERLPRTAADDVGLPDLRVGVYDWVLAHDHLAKRSWLIFRRDLSSDWRERLAEIRERIRQAGPTSPPAPRASARLAVSNFTRAQYMAAIAKAKDYIAAGDIYQVCLSQRFELHLDLKHRGDPWALYRRLRAVSPVPYGAYLGFTDGVVASASPELFLRLQDRHVETRPIKGTRPRGRSASEDRALRDDLIASLKDRAENLMIVDLLRNDLGRVCEVGSVRVPELFTIESYSTVHHMVSSVTGQLAAGLDAVDLLRSCFPGGSVTGCPKIRAMEIIDELEPTARGAYCGAIGFLGFDGSMDTNIVIRTLVLKNGRAYLQVGGAIVADSDPAAEFQETLDKAQAAFLALQSQEPSPLSREPDRCTVS